MRHHNKPNLNGPRIRVILRIFFLLFMCGSVQKTVAQQMEFPASVKEGFYNYTTHHLPEKVFVHTDKDFYAAGEILWMKLYDVDGYFNRPLVLNQLAYVELLDSGNRPVLQTKVSIIKSSAQGSLYLPDTLATGTYRLRAYTNWMKNAPPEYFFHKNIIIVNEGKPAAISMAKAAAPYDIQFFPEGGRLVLGLQSTVAFKLADHTGNGLDGEGSLVDNDRDTILRFHPLRFGIGKFIFTPAAGHVYKTVVQFAHTVQVTPTYYSGPDRCCDACSAGRKHSGFSDG